MAAQLLRDKFAVSLLEVYIRTANVCVLYIHIQVNPITYAKNHLVYSKIDTNGLQHFSDFRQHEGDIHKC